MQGTIDLILLRCRRTEDCDHRVADELLDRPSRLGDLGRHPVVEAVEQRARPLCILGVRNRRRTYEVGE